MRLLRALPAALLLAASGAGAVEPPPPIIGPQRQREDYAYLADPARRAGHWWEPLKHIPLAAAARPPFATLGLEIRLRYELLDNDNFGAGPQDDGGYLLTRYLPYLAISLPLPAIDARLDLVGQPIFAFDDYDQRGSSPVDEESADVLQLFGKLDLPLADGRLTLQAGRQVISYGSERLLGSRYGPNVLLSFDGGLARWTRGPWSIEGFYLRPVQVTPDPLDNLSGADQQLWGIYATRQLGADAPSGGPVAVDLYYLGFSDDAAQYNAGTGSELRHTLGTRFFGSRELGFGALDWNWEGFLQFGRFDPAGRRESILAWSVGTETGYTFPVPATPRLALRANVISGDGNPNDDTLGTFNPLFPKGKYFGELTPIGPSNLINLQGVLSLRPVPQVTLAVSGGPYWRYSTEDAVYGLGGNIVRAPGNSDARFIGTQIEFLAEWTPRRELGFLVSYSQFQPGDFLRDTGPAATIHLLAAEVKVSF